MKRPSIPHNMQFNLPLPEAAAAALPDGAEKELSRALVELLVSAARESVSHPVQGGRNESEVDD